MTPAVYELDPQLRGGPVSGACSRRFTRACSILQFARK